MSTTAANYRSLAWQIMDPNTLERFSYAPTDGSFFAREQDRTWFKDNEKSGLNCAGRQLFGFYAAGYKAGFLGSRVTLDMLANAVNRCSISGRFGSARTASRARDQLLAAGLIKQTWWTPPASTTKTLSTGPKPERVPIYDNVFEIDGRPGEYHRKRIRVITLTKFAIELLNYKKGSKKESRLHLATYDKVADNGSLGSFNIIKEITKPCLDDLRPLDPVSSSHVMDEPKQNSEIDPVLDSMEAAKPLLGSFPEAEKKQTHFSGQGCTVAPPPVLGRNWLNTWKNGRLALLASLFYFLGKHPSHVANALFARARFETGKNKTSKLICCINWNYYISRWKYTPSIDRRQILRNEILPRLYSCVEYAEDGKNPVLLHPDHPDAITPAVAPPPAVAPSADFEMASVIKRISKLVVAPAVAPPAVAPPAVAPPAEQKKLKDFALSGEMASVIKRISKKLDG